MYVGRGILEKLFKKYNGIINTRFEDILKSINDIQIRYN